MPVKQLLACALLSFAALDAQATPATVTAGLEAQLPDRVVRETTEKMQALIRENHEKYKANQEVFYKVVDEVLVPHFDVRYIAQLVLGKNWRSASEEQRTRFVDAFKLMLIRSYADTLLDNYDTIKAEWLPLRMAPGVTEVTVHMTLMRTGGQQPVPIGFYLRRVDDAWKVYDISVEAISLVTNFKSQIGAEIKRTSLDDVTSRMQKGEAFRAKSE